MRVCFKGTVSRFGACANYDASKITSIVYGPIGSDMSICKSGAKFARVVQLSRHPVDRLTQSILFAISKFVPSQCTGNVISLWIIQLPALWRVVNERWEP